MNYETTALRYKFDPVTGLRKQSIVLIDDSEDALLTEQMMLEMEGFQVFTAGSGEEGLQLLRQLKSGPDLILLDMQLGDMLGSQFLKFLAQQSPEIAAQVPIVYLTGMDDPPTSIASGHIRKPFDFHHFIKAVRRFIQMGTAPACG
jgi:CheY-like chemotaxis protein